jgi:hypothetical protein
MHALIIVLAATREDTLMLGNKAGTKFLSEVGK